jgi:hypothetical protein
VNHYLKYRLNKRDIFNILNNNNTFKTVNFFIDLQSIARGLYNKNLIALEVSNYIQNGNVLPTTLLNELRIFLNDLHTTFEYYHPRFVIFYDDGNNNQNKSISKTYKSNRPSASQNLINHINNSPKVMEMIQNKQTSDFDKILSDLNVKKVEPEQVQIIKKPEADELIEIKTKIQAEISTIQQEILTNNNIKLDSKIKIQDKFNKLNNHINDAVIQKITNNENIETSINIDELITDIKKEVIEEKFHSNIDIISNKLKPIVKKQLTIVKKEEISHQLTYEEEEEYKNTFRIIKKYYFSEIVTKFNIKGLSKIIYMQDYETDFIPYYFLKYKFESDDALNIILSMDKDLLQCCKFKNTFQVTTNYLPSQSKIITNIYDDRNAISYIYDSFKPGILTAEYIPLILSISGDKADGIPGVPGIGYANAIKLIMKTGMLPEYPINVPSELENYKEKIQNNYKMISFDEQISRLPVTTKNLLDNNLIF